MKTRYSKGPYTVSMSESNDLDPDPLASSLSRDLDAELGSISESQTSIESPQSSDLDPDPATLKPSSLSPLSDLRRRRPHLDGLISGE
ncbi:hypothetical protein CRG98_047199 [Punica granatum]|uniref:Uncharacterized protein n=1 Tax=Punica granatum TaxID=22663 RepID=A0A2I0HLQ5_PUNGR|nr:hypothetical protein CRG98_047199 [Punica granatum]